VRILITNTGPWGTGSAVVAEAVHHEFRRLGHKAALLFPDSQFETSDRKRYYGRPDLYYIWRFPVERDGRVLATFPLMITDPHPRNVPKAPTFRDLSKDLFRFYLREARRQLEGAVKRFRPDLVECHHIWATAYLAHQMGLPYVTVAHHSDQMGFHYDERMRSYAIEAARGASWIFSISEFVKREVLALYPGVKEQKTVVLENGYDQRIFFPRRCQRAQVFRSLRRADSPRLPLMTFAGKLSRTKGIDVLMRANQLVQRERKALLLLAGAGRLEDEFNVEERAEFHWENVVFLGQVQQPLLAKLHNLATLSLMPSRTEGFGIAALEAMGCGTPVIATRSGGPETFVVGDLIQAEDPEALAGAILNLLSLNPQEQRGLRQAALQRARQYSWKEIVKRRLDYFNQMR